MRRTLPALIVFIGLLAGSTVAHAAAPLIGYVNLQRAILEVEEGKRAKAELKKTFEKKQKALASKEGELKAMKDALDQQSVVDNAATRAKRAEFEAKFMELQQTLMAEQQALQQLESKALSKITDKMRAVIGKIGKADGYTIILEIQESRLLFAKPHLDITNQVIRKYNQKYK